MSTNRLSNVGSQRQEDRLENAEMYPLAAAATCLLVGIAVGVVAALLTTPTRQQTVAERVGQHFLSGLRSITPRAWST